MDAFSRTEQLIGKEALARLARSRVAVFGIGGVGGYVVEALVRSGVGALDLIDSDTVDITNLNRQIIATEKTIGKYKADTARERCLTINPLARIAAHRVFYLPETAAQFDFTQFDYIVDAIDTVSGKLSLIEHAIAAGTPIISCMGTGNKMDPSALEAADISQTSVCPLARVMRRELRKRGIEHVKVVYSKEPPVTLPKENGADSPNGCASADPGMRRAPGSITFVPAAAGLLIASQVVRDLIQ